MIVVAGDLRTAPAGGGTVGAIAQRIAARGSSVEVVGVLDADASGDKALQALRATGVGHAAVLRSPARELEPADLDLALRYLPDLAAIVLVGLSEPVVAVGATAAAWSGAGLVIVASADGSGAAVGGDAGDGRTIVLAAPARDPDGAFAGLVAALAVQLAGGATSADAWAETTASLGIEPVSPSA